MYVLTKPYLEDELKSKIEEYKKLADFFDASVFDTHREWDGEDFYLFVKQSLDDAKSYILNSELISETSLEFSESKISYILKFYDIYAEVILLGLKGQRSLAYQLFKKQILPGLETPFRTFRILPGHKVFDQENISCAYRIRTGADSYNSNFSKKDLFHIPFELNHLVGNNRFSLSGFPCLYMSSSVYGAWEELSRPPIEKCFVSKLDLTHLNFIDLSVMPFEMVNKLESHISFLESCKPPLHANDVESFEYYFTDYLLLWPVILCCSFKVKNQSVFKPEYIFPQLILEWLVSISPSWFDGVRFTSTKSLALEGHIDKSAYSLAKNYVIPARQYKNQGFCSEYSRKIKLTEPVNYAFYTLFGNNSTVNSSTCLSKYEDTVFGKLESILDKKELSNVAS